MKAITINQPFASLLACGVKKYVTMPWETDFRGKIAIHSGKDGLHRFNKDSSVIKVIASQLKIDENEYGAILAVAEITECWKIIKSEEHRILLKSNNDNYRAIFKWNDYLEIQLDDFSVDRYAFEFCNIQELEKPVKANGRGKGLWEWIGYYDLKA